MRDARAWQAWLGKHHSDSNGVWLVLAKKGTAEPTSLTYTQALEEALCHGWIDGQARSGTDRTYTQGFTPRRRRSQWSKRNTGIAEQLANSFVDASGLADGDPRLCAGAKVTVKGVGTRFGGTYALSDGQLNVETA